MNPILLSEFVRLVREDRDEITADDVTRCGQIVLDPSAAPNAKQNGIGRFFTEAQDAGWVVDTNRTRRSQSPRRKGGKVGIWQITSKARFELR